MIMDKLRGKEIELATEKRGGMKAEVILIQVGSAYFERVLSLDTAARL